MNGRYPEIRIGTRGSRLALIQTEQVKGLLEQSFPGITVTVQVIHTLGDAVLDKGLSQIGDRGLFTGALEQALLRDEIDLAVHSMKDVPSLLPSGLVLAAVLKRETPADVLVSACAASVAELKKGAVIGTSSLRRTAQLKRLRPDVQVVNIRGNVETRLRKMEEESLDGILLAAAGLTRLGLDRYITQALPADQFLPAVGQGAIGLQAKAESSLLPFFAKLDDAVTHACVLAERAFLSRLEGGCQVPLAALCVEENSRLCLKGRVISLDGQQLFEGEIGGKPAEAEALGAMLAEQLIRDGAQAVLDAIRPKTGGSV